MKLRERVDNLEQWTVNVGLASISNDDSSWCFATDSAELSVDAAGELVLTTQLSLMGEPSALSRFSYQIVCTSRKVTSSITGKITWPTALFRPPSADPAGVSGLFTIVANERRVVRNDVPGVFQNEEEVLTPVTPGEVVAVRIGENECEADYRIVEPPKGKQLKVTVQQHGMALPAGYNNSTIAINPGPNGDLVTLTPLQPKRSGIDFVVVIHRGPR